MVYHAYMKVGMALLSDKIDFKKETKVSKKTLKIGTS